MGTHETSADPRPGRAVWDVSEAMPADLREQPYGRWLIDADIR